MLCAYRATDLDSDRPISVVVMSTTDVYIQEAPHIVASTLFDSPGFIAIEPCAAALERCPHKMAELSFVPKHSVIAIRAIAAADFTRQFKVDAEY